MIKKRTNFYLNVNCFYYLDYKVINIKQFSTTGNNYYADQSKWSQSHWTTSKNTDSVVDRYNSSILKRIRELIDRESSLKNNNKTDQCLHP